MAAKNVRRIYFKHELVLLARTREQDQSRAAINLRWYCQRISQMELREVVWRVRDTIIRRILRPWRVALGTKEAKKSPLNCSFFAGNFLPLDRTSLPTSAVEHLTATADALLGGRWLVFGQSHPELWRECPIGL